MSNRIHRPGETVPTSGQYGDAGYVSAEYGFMARSLNLGLQIGSEHSEISPPIEVPFPLFGTRLDALYCEALWNVLNADSDERSTASRRNRLARCCMAQHAVHDIQHARLDAEVRL